MLLSYKWLKEYVNITDSPEKLADKITRGGLEVEEVIKLDKELSGLVVGYVKEKVKHPEADKLNVCKVDVGEEADLQIVCGASNVAEGQYVIVAKVGATLPGLKIKKAKLRGVESEGMICSLKELGLQQSVLPKNSQEGIYVFSEQQAVGTDAIKLLGLDDSIIDISITPNRADALSMRGLVHEVCALYNLSSTFDEKIIDNCGKETNLDVKIVSDNCLNYYGRVINNVKIEDSPLWLQTKLIHAGIRPINNIVDVTNYILLEYGQPMHAFDKELLGENILVRQAKDNELLTTLDNEERKLTENDLVITDGEKAVALAGVMGGKDTEVSDKTTNIVLESAYFNPVSVRKTSSYHGLRSDSSSRFEKGIDPKLQLIALEKATELIVKLCPSAEVEKYVGQAVKVKEKEVEITTEYINGTLGTNLSSEEITNILNSLGFAVRNNDNTILVTIPTRRPDISIKQDIAEEVIRMYGYDNLVSTLPKFSKSTKGGLTYRQKMIRELRRMYLNVGFSDTINYSLVSKQEATSFVTKEEPTVSLLMPMTETHSTLRQSLIPGLLNTLKYNQARQQKNIKLIEIGKVFFGSNDDKIQPKEELYISGVITGSDNNTRWLKEENNVNFYTVKGYLELIFKKLGITNSISYEKLKLENMHPGRTARVLFDNNEIGFIGEIHPLHARDLDITTTYVFEINLDKILSDDKVKPIYEEISKYPSVTRDIAMLINKTDEYKNIVNVIKELESKLITNIELFDIYEGIGLPENKKSIAISITYNDKEKTLTEEDITNIHTKVVSALESYGAVIR